MKSACPKLVKCFKIYDTCDIKFIVADPSAYYMKNMLSESLAGRNKLFDVYPLNFAEMLSFKWI